MYKSTLFAVVAFYFALGGQHVLAAPAGSSSVKSATTVKSASSVESVTSKAPETKSASSSPITKSASTLTKSVVSTSPSATAVANPGDDQANPIERAFPCDTSDEDTYPGIQELFDADCYAHLCQDVPVTLNRWDQSDRNRGVANGNGVASHNIFVDTKKWNTKSPGTDYNSPEEWAPASSAQGGVPATLMPVTQKAQGRQATLISAFYAKKDSQGNTIVAQKGVSGSSKGSWFRITEWTGAKGPYCQKLNDLLDDFSTNFDSTGVIKSKPSLCTDTNLNMNGLEYDPGKYAYKVDPSDKNTYNYVGK